MIAILAFLCELAEDAADLVDTHDALLDLLIVTALRWPWAFLLDMIGVV